jgi:uncharacterized protein with HEPN domain
MQIKIQKYLYDIKVAIDSIADYIGENKDFDAYKMNKQLRRAVERELEIIGEAANNILILDPDINIENARKIVDLRNWVIHGYDKVDDIIIWGIITKHIPVLKEQIELLLEN